MNEDSLCVRFTNPDRLSPTDPKVMELFKKIKELCDEEKLYIVPMYWGQWQQFISLFTPKTCRLKTKEKE